ncbi:MAG: type IX secretion system membrane protein PorP/SprF, partial [Bacteroidota bacterium]
QDQFNGVDGYPLATGEELPENNFSFSDFSVGLNYTISPVKGLSFFIGGAMHHVFEPEVSFFARQASPNETVPETSRLYRKYSAQLSAQVPLADKISLLPRFLFALQGPHIEMNAGSNIRLALNDYSSTAVHFGTWARPVTNEDGNFFVDALVLMVGLEYSNVLFGFSYDATLSDLASTRSGQGAFEISVAYLGNYDNETILCPKF